MLNLKKIIIMKKNYFKCYLFVFMCFLGVSANAQGTWSAVGTESLVAAGASVDTQITGLSVSHSDGAGVTGKTDSDAPSVSYNGVSWTNASYLQGSTNGMYFVFQPTANGTLDLSIKMGSAKRTFVLEISSECPNSSSLATLTSSYTTGASIYGTASYFSTPSVYDTYNNSTTTWNGTAAIQSTGSNQYLVMSFAVNANKMYVVGCDGSKLMLRGVLYKLASTTGNQYVTDKDTFTFNNPAKGNVLFQINEPAQVAIFNAVGALKIQKEISSADNTIDISALAPGIYFVKDMNHKYKTQKLIIE